MVEGRRSKVKGHRQRNLVVHTDPRNVVFNRVVAKLSTFDLRPSTAWLGYLNERVPMAIPRNIIEAARRYVRQHYPDMDGMRCTGEEAATGRYIVTARRHQATEDGRSIERIVRVTLDEGGKVLRASSSK